MGWWDLKRARDPDVWGDEPADIMSDALEEIDTVFKKEVGRRPTEFELQAGLEFSMGGLFLDEEE